MKRLILSLVWLFAAVAFHSAYAADVDNNSNAPVAQANLQYFNRTVFTFRTHLLGISAEDRARRALTRIHEQLSKPGPHQVSLKTDSLGTLVQIDGATAFVVSAGDADRAAEQPPEQAAQNAAAALTQAIAETRESRELETMLHAAGKALLATAVMGLVIGALQWSRKAFGRWLVPLSQSHTERLQLGGVTLLQRERVASAVQWLQKVVFHLLTLLVIFEWLGYVLSCFPYTRVWGETLNSYLLGLLGQFASAIVSALPGLFTAIVIFYLARLATRALDGFFERVRLGQLQLQWLDADVAVPTRRIAKVVLWLFALAMAYPALPGSQTEAFKGLSVLAGLMISLGASNLVGQAASGMILTYGRVYRKGEYIRVEDHEGTITELGMFATRIRTGLGEELTISNSTILGGTTKNYSRTSKGGGFVLDTTVTIGYNTPWRQVHAMLIEAAQRTDGVLTDPQPVVFQTALSDWYPQYRLVCQAVPTEPRPRALLLSALHANIQDVFNSYGVQIMSPQYFEDPVEAKVVPRNKWFTPPARPEDGA